MLFVFLSTFALSSIVLLLIIALVMELRTGRISNRLTFYGVLWGFGLAIIDQDGWLHSAGAVVGIMVGVTMFVCGIAGGGFAKFIATVGTIMGPLFPVVIAAVSLLLLACCYVVTRISPPPQLRYVDETPSWQGIYGSVVAAAGTVTGFIILGIC